MGCGSKPSDLIGLGNSLEANPRTMSGSKRAAYTPCAIFWTMSRSSLRSSGFIRATDLVNF